MKNILLLSLLVLVSGCGRTDFFSTSSYMRSARSWDRAEVQPAPPHNRPIFIARGPDAGRKAHWGEVHDAIEWADVIFLGERHTDQTGHDTKKAILESWDGRGVLSMEMLERDQQAYVDDWSQDLGVTDKKSADEILHEKTKLWKMHDVAYAPLMKVAKKRHWPIIAANASRPYVRLARTDGFAALRRLTDEQKRLFVIPRTMQTGRYREDFFEAMGHLPEHMDKNTFFRSQSIWDATMADSIYKARKKFGHARIFHAVGAFHTDFGGGVIHMLRRLDPNLRIINISMVQKDSDVLEDEDYDRADFVIYTGEPPEEEEAVEEQKPTEKEAAETPAEETEEHTPAGEKNEDEAEGDENPHTPPVDLPASPGGSSPG
ncbi:MAG TPA: hypothetical protein ENJ06_00565 [Phycisphaeraceae bacterium]|nr:hypothetical protein [Phycisphaeraceae bacterium]